MPKVRLTPLAEEIRGSHGRREGSGCLCKAGKTSAQVSLPCGIFGLLQGERFALKEISLYIRIQNSESVGVGYSTRAGGISPPSLL